MGIILSLLIYFSVIGINYIKENSGKDEGQKTENNLNSISSSSQNISVQYSAADTSIALEKNGLDSQEITTYSNEDTIKSDSSITQIPNASEDIEASKNEPSALNDEEGIPNTTVDESGTNVNPSKFGIDKGRLLFWTNCQGCNWKIYIDGQYIGKLIDFRESPPTNSSNDVLFVDLPEKSYKYTAETDGYYRENIVTVKKGLCTRIKLHSR